MPDPRTAEERLRADFDADHELQVWYDEEGVEACKTCGVGWPCSAVALVEVLAAEPVPLDVERLARAMHDQRQVQSFAGCGWKFASVVDDEALCPCPNDAADLLRRMDIGS